MAALDRDHCRQKLSYRRDRKLAINFFPVNATLKIDDKIVDGPASFMHSCPHFRQGRICQDEDT